MSNLDTRKMDGVFITGSTTLANMVFASVPGYGVTNAESDIWKVKRRDGGECNAIGARVAADGILSVRLVSDRVAGRNLFRPMAVYAGSNNDMLFDAIQKTGSTASYFVNEGELMILE